MAFEFNLNHYKTMVLIHLYALSQRSFQYIDSLDLVTN